MTTRESAIKNAIEDMNRLGGLMEEALEFNETTVEATLKTVTDIENACGIYRDSLYELRKRKIEWSEVLAYAEEESASKGD